MRFEFDGSAIAVTKKYSGVFLYDTITAELALHLQLPKGERRVGWTCYSSHKCKGDKGKGMQLHLFIAINQYRCAHPSWCREQYDIQLVC